AVRFRQYAMRVALLLAGASVTGVGLWVLGERKIDRHQPVRFPIVPPVAQPLNLLNNPSDRPLAITPDGTKIVYRAGTVTSTTAQLVLRSLDELEPRVLFSVPPPLQDPFIS